MSDTRADCIGGGYAYVGHGEDCVMVAFSPEVGWWRNSIYAFRHRSLVDSENEKW